MNSRLVVLGLGALTVVTACSSGSSGGTPTSPPTAVATSTSTPTATVTATPTPTVTVTAPISARSCRSNNLSLSLAAGQGTAGATYQSVVFTNTGSAHCTLDGYPGVSFVDASGTLIGKPSAEVAGKEKRITLAPGGQASALLKQPDPGAFSPSVCHPKTADRLRAYPPGEKIPLFVHDSVQVCSTSAGRTQIAPVVAGSGQ